RRKRIEKRKEARRGLIEQAMTVAGWQKKETALGTISMGKGSHAVVIDAEAVIPTRFWKRADPTLKKADLGVELRDHQKRADAAFKLKEIGQRVDAVTELAVEVADKLPAYDALQKRIKEAAAINDHAERADAFAAIIRSVSPIPGAHLEQK